MKHLYKGALAVMAWSAFAVADAQIYAPSYSGSFRVDNQPYNGGPILWFSHGRITAGAGSPGYSDATLSPTPHALGNSDGRTMLKFKAGGNGDLSAANWKLPSAADGSVSNALQGEERVFSTWTPGWCIAPQNSHAFHSEVSLQSDTAQAWVDIDVQQAPKPFYVSSQGEFTHSFFDNGSYDMNPQTGGIVLDKNATPNAGLDFSMPSFTMHRDVVYWQIGGESASTFYDESCSDIWVIFDGPNAQYVFRGPNSDSIYFDPGEGAEDKDIANYAGSMSLALSQIAGGTYNVHYWAVPWTADYTDENHQVGCSSGFVAFEHMEYNVQVVPEPATLLAWLGGVGGLATFRRKRRR